MALATLPTTTPSAARRARLAGRDSCPAPISDGRPDISVVVLSFQVRDLLLRCLQSLVDSIGDFTYEVIVVDNCSTDGSVQAVRAAWPNIEVIASTRNSGFAWGNNLGLARARGRFLLLLNPDTEVAPDALAKSLALAEARPELGAIGAKLIRTDGRLDLACRRSFPTPVVALCHMLKLHRLFPRRPWFGRYNLTYLDPDVATEVDGVAGAYMFARRAAIEQVGLLDERYFMYGEDLDWAYRLKSAGWRIWYEPSIVVIHHKGSSSRQNFGRANAAFYRAMLRFHRVHLWPRTPAPINFGIVLAVYLRWGLAKFAALCRPAARRVGSS